MRKLLPLVFATTLFAANVYAVESQPLDESTNPNANTNTKTQKLQQKPNNVAPQPTDDRDNGYREPSGSRADGDTNSNNMDEESSTNSSGSYR